MEYGCIAKKLSHSFSKTIHNMLCDYDYQYMELSETQLESFMINKPFKAINVTIPYKQDVIKYLDYTDSIAKNIGAVNTIVNKDGKLYGYNTDFSGMIALINKIGLCLENKKVVILGSGGTSKTAYEVAKFLKAKEVFRVSRSGKDGAITYETLYEFHKDTDILINTTPCGMYPEIDNVPVDIDIFTNLSGVVDAVYNPLRSKLVMSAKQKGIKAEGGLYMLVSQAVFASEHFTGREFDKSEIDRIYSSILKQKENIVLTGMAGCGKTTLGREIAKKLGMDFVDTDEEIVKKQGKAIPEIFKESGEAEFRRIESQVIAEISGQTAIVIATGGGAVLNEQNVQSLKQNGKVIFIDRDIERINPTDDRPLSDNYEKLKALYNERLPIYIGSADIRIKTDGTIDENVRRIINECSNN